MLRIKWERGWGCAEQAEEYPFVWKRNCKSLGKDFLCVEIKSRIDMEKAAFGKKKAVWNSKLDFNLRQKQLKSDVWSTALCGAETGTVRESGSDVPCKVLKCAGEGWRR